MTELSQVRILAERPRAGCCLLFSPARADAALAAPRRLDLRQQGL